MGKKHATVDYVFLYTPYKLYQFHVLVMDEMKLRGYHPDEVWYNKNYRGKKCLAYENLETIKLTTPIYPEHNKEYFEECIRNLERKNIKI